MTRQDIDDMLAFDPHHAADAATTARWADEDANPPDESGGHQMKTPDQVLTQMLHSLIIGRWLGYSHATFENRRGVDPEWDLYMLDGMCGLTAAFVAQLMGRHPDDPHPLVIEGHTSAASMLLATMLNGAHEQRVEILHALTPDQVVAAMDDLVEISARLCWQALGPEGLPGFIGWLAADIPGLTPELVEQTTISLRARWAA